MVPTAQHRAESKPCSHVGLFQAIGHFASPLNHDCDFWKLHMWSTPWDLILHGHTHWLLILMLTPSCFSFPVLPAVAHMASCPGSWMSAEAAVPAKPQNMFERRAVEPASTLGSAGTAGHSQNNPWSETGLCPGKERVTAQELCYNKRVCLCLDKDSIWLGNCLQIQSWLGRV